MLLAALGFGFGYKRLRESSFDGWALFAAVTAFLLSGAVVFLTGKATFAGYGVLGDTAVHMIGADYLVHHGRSFGGNESSAYLRVLLEYFDINGYPSGLHTALGTLAVSVGSDVAWVYQPFLSILLAFLALAFYSIASASNADRRWSAFIAMPASMPAIIYGFYLQGSLKEIGFATLLATLGATCVWFADKGNRSYRAGLVPVLAAAACIATIGLAALPWLVPLPVIAVLGSLVRSRKDLSWKLLFRTSLAGVASVAAVAVLIIPTLTKLGSYLQGTKFLVQQSELGNLLHGPISPLEMFGTWFADDYRVPPGINYSATYLLIAFAAALAIFALIELARRRKLVLLGFTLVTAVATVFVVLKGSPWADAKAFAIAAPFVMLLATLGCFYLAQRWRPVAGVLAIGVVIAGVSLSDLFEARKAKLAPSEKFEELSVLNRQLSDSKATLVGGFDEFSKYFLRDAAPDTLNDSNTRIVQTTDGTLPVFGKDFPIEKLLPPYLRQFDALVLEKGSKQPDPEFKLERSGRYFDLWLKRDR